MMDLSKLTPAPWRFERRYSNECEVVPRIHCERSKDRECGWVADCVGAPYLGYESTLVNAEFIALARNAFDVMMRRGWVPTRIESEKWGVSIALARYETHRDEYDDPFTALVEAEKWYVENVESKQPVAK